MSALATRSMQGNLTSFSGIFGFSELNVSEKGTLHSLLKQFSEEGQEISEDLKSLITITSEVKAINNQAIVLHGERIKAVQEILKKYRDGAFSTWLVATYGNRQTPYNFLQYYEFYITMPQTLRPLIEIMPKQAVYTLASREGSLEEKQTIVQNYQGESKQELIRMIRDTFPLSEKDKRKQSIGRGIIHNLEKNLRQLKSDLPSLSESQKNTVKTLLQEMLSLLD